MTTHEIQLVKRYAEKNNTTWDMMVKNYCESILVHAIIDARAEITKDLTTEDITAKIYSLTNEV